VGKTNTLFTQDDSLVRRAEHFLRAARFTFHLNRGGKLMSLSFSDRNTLSVRHRAVRKAFSHRLMYLYCEENSSILVSLHKAGVSAISRFSLFIQQMKEAVVRREAYLLFRVKSDWQAFQ